MDKPLLFSEDIFRRIVEYSPASVAITDPSGNIEYVNPYFEKLTGYAFAEVLGKNPRILKGGLMNPQDYKELWQTITSGKIWRGELRNKRKDGSFYWVEEAIAPILDASGKIVQYVGIAEDITQRREASLRLAAVANEWETTFNAISDMISIQSADYRLIRVNSSYAKAFGVDPKDLEGKTCHGVIHGLNAPCAQCPCNESIVKKSAVITEFFEPRLGIFVEVTVTPLFDKKGNFEGVVHVIKDISRRKELDRLKDEFIGTVSHELRTPLSIAREGVSLVLDGITGPVNDKQRQVLASAKDNVDRLTRIVNSLLDISKIKAGKMEIQRNLADLGEIIRKVAASFDARIREKGLEFRILLPAAPVRAYIDSDKMIGVFTNLINNAFKFTEKGFIEVSLRDKQDEIECQVGDSGIGIASDDLPKVFGQFQQFGRKAGSGEKGTGLGLAITKSIVEMHQGRISIESKLGEGTKFIFTIPKSAA